MRAVVFHGTGEIGLDEVPNARVEVSDSEQTTGADGATPQVSVHVAP